MCASYPLHKKHYSPFQDPLPAKCLGHFEFKTLLSSSSTFCKANIFFRTRPSNWQYVWSWQKQESGTKTFALCKVFQATMQAVRFLQVPPRPPFKRLVLSTTLWQHAKMSTILKSTEGLKDQEAPECLRIKLPDGTIFNMSIFSQGNTNEYLVHVVAILCAMNQKGLNVQ